MSERADPSNRRGGITRRSAEITVALIVFGLGTLVVYDSVQLGFRWGIEGPQAGYFPFYIGLVICISSAVVLIQALLGRSQQRGAMFVEWQALRQVLSVLLPAAVYVFAIQMIGIYVASALYIAGFMLWLGEYGWIKSALLGLVVSALSFITFEVWFQVPLHKGLYDPLAFLGY